LEPFHEFFGSRGDACSRIGGEFAASGGVFLAEDDPEAGSVGFVIAGADGAGELGEFETRAVQQFHNYAAGIINQVAKTL